MGLTTGLGLVSEAVLIGDTGLVIGGGLFTAVKPLVEDVARGEDGLSAIVPARF